MPRYNSQSRSRKKPLLLILLLVLLAAAGAYYYHARHNNNDGTQTTSKLKTAQSSFSSGNARNSNSAGLSQGTAVDEKGKTSGTASQGASTSSSSGVITLNSPTANATVASGDELSGNASVGTVQYRLVDDRSGVIAQGQLAVVNGKFSGKLQFRSYGSTGKLDVFNFDPDTGAEVNSISIGLKF